MSETWEQLRIGEAITELPKSKLQAGVATINGKYPFFCSSQTVKKCDDLLETEPAILLGTGGTATVHYGSNGFSYSTDTWGIRTNPRKLSEAYLYWALLNQLDEINYKGFEGSGLKHLQKGFIKNILLCLPATRVQQKIATILFATLRVINKTESQIKKLQDLKKGMMQELLTNGIGHTEFKDSPVGRIPMAWTVEEAGNLCDKVTKGTTPPQALNKGERSVPFLRVNNLSFDNKLHTENGLVFVTNLVHKGFLSRSIVFPGDILMNIVGPPLGKVAQVSAEYPEYNVNQAIIIYRVRDATIDKDFFLQYLGSSVASTWFETRAKKTSGQKNLTIELCKGLPVPRPPLEEQQIIVKALVSQDRLIEKRQLKLSQLRACKNALMQDLLTGKVRVTIN